MARLENTFSWSHSAAGDFELCRRKRYWSKYGAWGGWEAAAAPECRLAYRLNKMTNRYCMYGVATEDSVMWLLKRHQDGKPVSAKEAYDTVARPLLRGIWDESKNREYLRRPKAGCLHEHYYPQFRDKTDREIMDQIAGVVRTCLDRFLDTFLPKLSDITPDMEIPVAVVGKGDAEHFFLNGTKIYAIPDYVYVRDGVWHILDWKSGQPKPEHLEQVALYALWAREKHGISPDTLRLQLAYLQIGEWQEFAITAADLQRVEQRIHESLQDMTQYLINEDPAANRPLPKPEWDLCYDPAICRSCPFYELCAPELKAALGPELDG